MKALFLIFHDFSEGSGISKKIRSQLNALKECGLDVRLCYLTTNTDGDHKRMLENGVLENYGKGIIAKFKKRFCYSRLKAYILENEVQLLYIRSAHNANPFLIHLLKKVKKAGIKTVMEIPTYPYDQEYQKVPLSDFIRFYGDRLFRYRLARYIERIVTFSNDKIIFGTPTINLSNGIDFNQIKLKSRMPPDKEYLQMIGVAEIHFWHGFDRVLTGLAQYYKGQIQKKVYFDVVGEGVYEEMERLKTIVRTNHLEKYVTFHGIKSGAELDLLFENAHIGIGSLGRHRSGIIHIKPLKNREYAARGIPFVYAEIDDDFEDKYYVMKVPSDETPLDIEKVVAFYFQGAFEPAAIRNTIENTLSWKVQMKKVLDVIYSE
ncbi:MAG: hypothetical protein AB2L20_31920 [Mangrovibacterium sp.]